MKGIFVATPTANGLVTKEYSESVSRLAFECQPRSLHFASGTSDGTDLAQQRDHLVAMFLATPFSHLLSVDGDTSFKPKTVFTMLRTGKDVVGAIYPHRMFAPGEIERHIKEGKTESEALRLAHLYSVDCGGSFEQEGPLLRVNSVGTGLMLIARQCLERLRDSGALSRYTARNIPGELRGFFSRTMRGDELLTEDWSFCQRVRDAGMQVYAYPFDEVGHVGRYVHVSAFAEQFAKQKAPPE